MKPLWFANHQAHLHVATLVRLSPQQRKKLEDRFALACSLFWNDKNKTTRLWTDIVVVESPFGSSCKLSQLPDGKNIQNTSRLWAMTTSSALSSLPSYSRNSRSEYSTDHSLVNHKDWRNCCRAHFLLEKDCKKYDGKWNIYANWRTKVFNPATAHVETTTATESMEESKVSEWRELSHCLGMSFCKNPSESHMGNSHCKRQWEVGIESLKADRIQQVEYPYGFGVEDERQETVHRAFATCEMEYSHFLWKEKNNSSTSQDKRQYHLSNFIAMTGHVIARAEKWKSKPWTARATCSVGLQGQRGKLRRKWFDFSGFSFQVSQTVGALSTFLFEREEQRTALNGGLVQHLYGNCRIGLERRWTCVCWQPMETKLSLQWLGDSYTIATSYWMERGTAKLSCRWLW